MVPRGNGVAGMSNKTTPPGGVGRGHPSPPPPLHPLAEMVSPASRQCLASHGQRHQLPVARGRPALPVEAGNVGNGEWVRTALQALDRIACAELALAHHFKIEAAPPAPEEALDDV